MARTRTLSKDFILLRWRLASAAIIIAGLVTLLIVDYQVGRSGLLLIPLALIVAALASGELLRLFAAAGQKPVAWSLYAGNLLVVAANSAPVALRAMGRDWATCPLGFFGWTTLALAAAATLAFSVEMTRYRQPGGIIVRVALNVFAVVYVGVLLSFLVALRAFGDNAQGMAALLSLIVVVKMGDTGAYGLGRMIGKHKMTPLLSPGKTWEGALGALLASSAAAWLSLHVLTPWLTGRAAKTPWWGVLLYGVTLAVAGMIGDLSESLIKRDMGLKDSSSWLPGLGGVLDIIDSLLIAAPVAYLFWAAGLVGAG